MRFEEHHVAAAKSKAKRSRRKPVAKWSAGVTQRSDALDLERGVFTKRSARQVALSLKRSAERSRRRKSSPFRSAMSMLNFEINRAGRNLTPERRRVLTNAKTELRRLFDRPA
jgi:type IV secretory pathway VirB10-like protein